MDKIQRYITRFFEKTKVRKGYDMLGGEWVALAKMAKARPVDATETAFNFGYAKGYRAAMAEMKKGGVA